MHHFNNLIFNVINYDSFEQKLNVIEDNLLKGTLFEYFSYFYFKLIPYNIIQYNNIFLYKDIPELIKSNIKLPATDKGIDGILISNTNKYIALQIKFRKNKNIIPFNEIATFQALTFGTYCVNISHAIFFTNCYDVCNELKHDKYINITSDAFDKCDLLFWNNVRKYISHHPKDDAMLLTEASQQQITYPEPLIPLSHQLKILPIIQEYFNNNDYGRLYLPCGTGKCVMATFIALNVLQLSTIFICVPSLYLLSETYDTWLRQTNEYKFLLLGSDLKSVYNYEYILTTDINDIINFLQNNIKIIVITTYHSSYLLKDVCKQLKYTFDIGIYDEAHRTVGCSDKKFTSMLSHKKFSKKRLFMTATEKIYNIKLSVQDEQILSMDNENIYGKIIHNYSTRQAINDNQLVNYKVIAPFITHDKYKQLLHNNNYINILSSKDNIKEIKLLAIALMIIDVIKTNNIHHLLIFTNKNNKAKQINDMITLLSQYDNFNIECIYLNGTFNITKRKKQVKIFCESKRSIICSARIFGEGVNIPICDAVCFADNKSSTIDIVQYVGRCLRKCKEIPNKIGYVIIPFILDENMELFTDNNKSFLKLRRILKALGTTDDIISDLFIIKDCNKIIFNKHDENKEIKEEIKIGYDINVNEFRQHIISKIFDKDGDPELRIRNILIHENKYRYINKQELIDTKKKCISYLKLKNETKIPVTVNWIKFCLGNDLFIEIKKKYYYSKDDLKLVLLKLNINNFDEYKIKYINDPKLPHPDYINDGFYYDLDNKFDIMNLIEFNNEDFNY